MITEAQFMVELINFSSGDRPITARAMYTKYATGKEKLEDYQRTIAKYARKIQKDQFKLSPLSKPEKLVFSSNEGYYIAKNRKEADDGLNYYTAKILEMLRQRRKIKIIIQKTYPEPEQTSMFQ